MNYKLLFPTYRTRYNHVRQFLQQHVAPLNQPRVLNLGTGEGDYDPMIAALSGEMIACDIHEPDVRFAEQLNAHVSNLTYQVENALDLSFPDNHFDVIISIDVIEHTGDPDKMIEEIYRVLKPGGKALVTFPQVHFPITYDPVNFFRQRQGKKPHSFGAYGFGHWYLVDAEKVTAKGASLGLTCLDETNLTGALAGVFEMYWIGAAQSLLKENAANASQDEEKKVVMRPSTKEPLLAKVTDGLIGLDRALLGRSKYSVGKGLVFQKA
ncbi:MAG: class I SAM-dependent methyltransferase [Bacteroidota bacterium]